MKRYYKDYALSLLNHTFGNAAQTPAPRLSIQVNIAIVPTNILSTGRVLAIS